MLTLTDISNKIKPIIEESPIQVVTVFGSFARGTNADGSDIDMVIDSHGALKGIDFFIWADKIARTLPIKSDIFEAREIKKESKLNNRIKKEGVVIYERTR